MSAEVDNIKEEIAVLEAKLLIFQSKANNSMLDQSIRLLFATKARKTRFKISQLKGLIGHSDQPSPSSLTRGRKSDGHV